MNLGRSEFSEEVRHRGITIDGHVLAEMYYESLNLPKFVTPSPFLSAEEELARRHNEAKGRLAAERLARRYVQDVINLVEKIHATRTGCAVLDAIKRAPMGDGIQIVPDVSKPEDWPNAGVETIEPIGRSRKREPKEAVVFFTPANWQRDDALAVLLKKTGIQLNDDWGPGSLPDEVLLHELVHALFVATGKQPKRRVPFQGRRYLTDSWSNNPKHANWRGPFEMDEFMAIMITNIYHSECGGALIRHSHQDFVGHNVSDTKFLDFGINRAHIQLLRRKQPGLFNALNDIAVPWNPLRYFPDSLSGRA